MPFPSEPLNIPTVSPGRNLHTYIRNIVSFWALPKIETLSKREREGEGVCMSGVILVCLLVENVQACETLVKILENVQALVKLL